MNRTFAILFCILFLGLMIVMAATEQDAASEAASMTTLVLHLTDQVILVLSLVMYCGFAALHSTQYISSPQERTRWLIATIAGNVFGSCCYFLTTYQSFRKAGKGGLMSFRNTKEPARAIDSTAKMQ